jgi:hypothetical protein
MQGPPLTGDETLALLERGMERLTELGVGRDRAISEVARRYGVDVAKVCRLLGAGDAAGTDPATPLAA